ncbi:hypothetical protein HAX54_007293 [Datura stramonium]|uniref:Uncharacterized protein n=1 Tax=Datura stramonium TaxID=4076 RepID=A0ABS8WWQ6_DATST|nr:hypothetical protein [Datura stramonium]
MITRVTHRDEIHITKDVLYDTKERAQPAIMSNTKNLEDQWQTQKRKKFKGSSQNNTKKQDKQQQVYKPVQTKAAGINFIAPSCNIDPGTDASQTQLDHAQKTTDYEQSLKVTQMHMLSDTQQQNPVQAQIQQDGGEQILGYQSLVSTQNQNLGTDLGPVSEVDRYQILGAKQGQNLPISDQRGVKNIQSLVKGSDTPTRANDQDQSNNSKSKNKLSKKRRDALKKKLEVQHREAQVNPNLMIEETNISSPSQGMDNQNNTIESHKSKTSSQQSKQDTPTTKGTRLVLVADQGSSRNPLFVDSQEGLSSTPDLETPIENLVPIACDPPDPVFAVCNLNTSSCRDFEVDDYRQIISEDETEYDSEEEPKNSSDDAHAMQLLQTFGATNSQMSETHVKKVTDRQGLSPRGASHFSPGSGTGPPAARTRLKAKTRH